MWLSKTVSKSSQEIKVGTVEVPNSNCNSCSNISLLEMLACDAGGPSSIPGRDMIALVKDGDDLGQVSS